MKATDYIRLKLSRLRSGHVFTYEDFLNDITMKDAVIKALNRMALSGKITKLAKGKYYKSEESIFGNLQPPQQQVVKDLLENNNKIIGYLTGYSVYNQLGLTTQVSNTIQIGRNEIRPALKRGRYFISFIRQKNIINKDNIPLLQILDAIRYIKKIPDTTLAVSCKRLLAIIKTLPNDDKTRLVKLALKYSPATRALLGALLEEIGDKTLTVSLHRSLNPITLYKFTGAAKALTAVAKWNIR